MSTPAKPATQKSPKKAGCRYVQPISNDRADSCLGVRAEVCPRASEAPCARDKRAHDMMSKGWTQRRIAAKLGCSQPTVQRAIRKCRLWFGTTLPEDRGEITGFAKSRIAVEEHRIFLEHQKRLAMQEWRRSRQPVRKPGGKKGADQTGQPVQRRNANVSHFNAATRLSLQLTMLQAGYLGTHRLACDMALDIDERDRWQRERTTRDATIAELRREVAELTSGSGVFGGCVLPLAQPVAPKTPDPSLSHESENAESTPVLHQHSSPGEVATPTQPIVCDQPLDSPGAVSPEPEYVNQDAGGVGFQPAQVEVSGRLEACPTPSEPEEKRFRWEDKYRQEALDYHCMIHGIPPLELHQVVGLPDPKHISPKMAIERGYPYILHCDRSIPSKREPVRDTRKVITVW